MVKSFRLIAIRKLVSVTPKICCSLCRYFILNNGGSICIYCTVGERFTRIVVQYYFIVGYVAAL